MSDANAPVLGRAEPGEPRWLVPLQAVLVIAATLCAFRPVFGAEFQLTWDDNGLLLNHVRWRGLGWDELRWMATAFHMGHYHPLTWLSFAVDYELAGLDPAQFHRTSLFLHAANGVLFLLLARDLLARVGSGDRWLPLCAALLYAIHPLRVESVAWVTERRDVLSGFFLLLTLLAWLRFTDRPRASWYLAALAAFALSLLSKPWGMTLPVVLLVLDAWPLGRLQRPFGACARLLVLEKLPFAALAGAIAVTAWLAQRASGAMTYASELSLVQTCAQACYGLVFYVRASLWPAGLLPIYDLPRDLDPTEPRFLASSVIVAAVAVGAAALARRRPALAVALAVYALLVSPVLGFAQSGRQLVADRYSYLACMPLVLLFAGALQRVAGRRAALVALPLAALCGWRTYAYSAVWKDSYTLWNHAVLGAPDCAFAWTHRGMIHLLRGNGTRALADFDEALRLDAEASEALESRALLYRRAGRLDLALADLERAIAVRPDRAIAFVNRGEIRFERGDVRGALADYEVAARLEPASPINHFNVAIAKERLGDFDGARAATLRALELEPEGTPFHARMKQALGTLPPP